MRYFLIKNCKIANRQETNLDILIAKNKIIAIGNGIARPSVDTNIFDAQGYLVTPGFIDICSPFLSLNNTEEIRRLIHDDVAGGYTTWIGFESATKMTQTLSRLGKQELRTLNYSLHFDADQFKHGDLNKMKSLSATYGLPSMRYTISDLQTAQNDRIDLYLATAAKNKMLLIFSLSHNGNIAEIPSALELICKKINNTKCKTLFANVRYVEEIEMINRLRTDNDTYAQICLAPHIHPIGNLNPIDDRLMGTMLRENKWICADIIIPDMPAPQRIAQSFDICKKYNITEEEITEYMTTRKCRIVGLTPEKGQIIVGGDADICIIKNGKIRAVVQNGKLTYDNGIIHENISGLQAFRRIIN